MKLWTVRGQDGSARILDTGGRPPTRQELGLFLTRSLTISQETLLVGPVSLGPCPEFRRLSPEGMPVPGDARDAAAFFAFLEAAGYGTPEAIRCGERIFLRNQLEAARWQAVPGPEGEALKRLLSL